MIFIPREYQNELLLANKRFKIGVFHRRAGKSITALNQQIDRATDPDIQPGNYYYFLPTYRQAKAVIWDSLIDKYVPKALIDHKNESELAIYYKNGSIQKFVGCEDIDKHRGINPIDVVFDEYSEMKEEIWTTIIRPVLMENHGSATFIFTPKGKNHSWKLVQIAKSSPEWFVSIKSVDDTKGIDEEELEIAKKEMPQAIYQQEMMCEFLDEAGAFFRRIKENTHCEYLQPIKGRKYQIGVDLAKYVDWTVITPIDLMDFKVHQQERFNQIDYNLQRSRIEATALRYGSDTHKPRLVVDATGVGDPIVEDLERMRLNVLGFKFTETSRKELLTNLAILLEQDKIKIPNDEGLIDELQSMRYEMSERGKLKLQVPEGMADDRIMSLALAVWELKKPLMKEPEWEWYKKEDKPDNPYSMFQKV